jgi:CBS domain-containing protein
MHIDQILNDKGREVVSVRMGQSLEAVAAMLDSRRVGAVVVLDGAGDIAGVVSERDLIRQVARQGRTSLDQPVEQAMTRAVVTIPVTASVDSALQLMTDRRVRHLPVMREDRLVGIVSIGDLVKWKMAETEAEAEAMKSYLSAQF